MGFIHGIPCSWIDQWIEKGVRDGGIGEWEVDDISMWVRSIDSKYMEYWGNKLSSRSGKGDGTMKKQRM